MAQQRAILTFKVGHIRRRRLIVMSILTILIFRLRRVTNVFLIAGLASPEHDEKWGLNPWHVTTELSDLVTRTRTRGAIIHRDKKAEAVEEESGAVLMTPGSSSSLPSSSAAAKSPSAIRTFCWWHKTLNQKCVTLKPLIGPNRFLRPTHWLLLYIDLWTNWSAGPSMMNSNSGAIKYDEYSINET